MCKLIQAPITPTAPGIAQGRHAEAGHVDPASAARWHQAQTELVGLIREESRTIDHVPEADRKELLPASLGDWMAARVTELEQAEAEEPEIEAIS
jgi:hypothetical protein